MQSVSWGNIKFQKSEFVKVVFMLFIRFPYIHAGPEFIVFKVTKRV